MEVAEQAQAIDERARLRLVADRVAPLALAQERTLPVLESLAGLFPEGGLRRGSVIAVEGIGATSLALAVAAGPSASGSWTAVVGDQGIGLAAAEEAGVVLERLLMIETPSSGSSDASAVAALVGAVDVVMIGPGVRLRPADSRRLSARMRERGSVIIRVGGVDAPGVDVGLRIVESEWTGLGAGHGLLRARRIRIETQGRGASSRPRAGALLLPGPQGAPIALGEKAAGEKAAGEKAEQEAAPGTLRALA
jgi:hypothetical protein